MDEVLSLSSNDMLIDTNSEQTKELGHLPRRTIDRDINASLLQQPTPDNGRTQWTPSSVLLSTPEIGYGPNIDLVSQLKATGALTHLRQGHPASKFAASLASDIICAFPQMMLRRQTFPPFIHSYWHRQSLPEALSNCASIAQLFANRTSESRSFLWRTIEAEQQHFRSQVSMRFSPCNKPS